MKSLICRVGVASLVCAALQACSINPSVPGGGSIEDFARALNGKRYQFDMTGRVWVPSMAGEPVTPQRIPKGLTVALNPAEEHCKRGGGVPAFDAMAATDFKVQLPQRLVCKRGEAVAWSLELRYFDTEYTSSAYLATSIRAQLQSAEQYAETVRKEEASARAQEQAATAQKDRQAAAERERQQRARDLEIEARRNAAQWPARVAAFQANLKAGDRFQWSRAPGGGGPFVGMVVRVEGQMAFVQFDNLTIAGQQTRYLARTELEPFDGPTPNFRRVID